MRRPLLLLLLCAAATLCAWAAVTGDPLLDDMRLVPLRRPFPAADIFAQPPRWQPAVTLSFRAVAALSPRRFATAVSLHHLFSLALFLVAVGLLLGLAPTRPPGATVRPWHALVLAAFALHPTLVEAYGHLSGRGEAIALAALAALALTLQRGHRALPLGFTLLGMAASPVAGPAAVALAAGAALDDPSARSRRTALAVALTAVVTALVTWGPAPTFATVLRWAARIPRAVSVVARTLLVPTETALRLPHWELSRPLTLVGWFLAALPLLVSVFLWRRGARGSAVRVLGVAACALPLVMRADSLAFGLDRYLVGPLVLVGVSALAAPPPAWIAALSIPARRLVGASAVALLALLGFMTQQTAGGFVSDAHQLDAMTQMRPRDPSGHLRNAWFAVRTGDQNTTQRGLRGATRQPLTPLMARVARAIRTAAAGRRP